MTLEITWINPKVYYHALRLFPGNVSSGARRNHPCAGVHLHFRGPGALCKFLFNLGCSGEKKGVFEEDRVKLIFNAVQLSSG